MSLADYVFVAATAAAVAGFGVHVPYALIGGRRRRHLVARPAPTRNDGGTK